MLVLVISDFCLSLFVISFLIFTLLFPHELVDLYEQAAISQDQWIFSFFYVIFVKPLSLPRLLRTRSHTGGDLKETGTVTPSPAHGFTSVFNGVRVVHILACFLCCVSFFV